MVLDYMKFDSKKEAEVEIEKMRGWPNAKPQDIFLSEEEQYIWVVAVGNAQYLRQDGYVQ